MEHCAIGTVSLTEIVSYALAALRSLPQDAHCVAKTATGDYIYDLDADDHHRSITLTVYLKTPDGMESYEIETTCPLPADWAVGNRDGGDVQLDVAFAFAQDRLMSCDVCEQVHHPHGVDVAEYVQHHDGMRIGGEVEFTPGRKRWRSLTLEVFRSPVGLAWQAAMDEWISLEGENLDGPQCDELWTGVHGIRGS